MRGEAWEPVLCWGFQADESDGNSKGLVASAAHCREAYLSASRVLLVCAGHPAAVWGAGPAHGLCSSVGRCWGLPLSHRQERIHFRGYVYSLTAPRAENKAEPVSFLEPLKSQCSQMTELPNQFCENYAFLLSCVLVVGSVETPLWTLPAQITF